MGRRKDVFSKEEFGSVVVLFALLLTVIVFFVGIAVDLSLFYMKRSDLENLCQLMREDRFTFQDTMRYADNPGRAAYQIAAQSMGDNGFNGVITVYFWEKTQPAEANGRYYKVRTQLSDDFSFHFLRIFGADTVKVKAHIDDVENYGEGGSDVIWHPSVSPGSYSGSYTGSAGGGYSFVAGDFPSDW